MSFCSRLESHASHPSLFRIRLASQTHPFSLEDRSRNDRNFSGHPRPLSRFLFPPSHRASPMTDGFLAPLRRLLFSPPSSFIVSSQSCLPFGLCCQSVIFPRLERGVDVNAPPRGPFPSPSLLFERLSPAPRGHHQRKISPLRLFCEANASARSDPRFAPFAYGR